MATKKKKRFPKRELNSWLKTHSEWSHQEWLGLLEDLGGQGFQEWTDFKEGQKEIGFYLETKRL